MKNSIVIAISILVGCLILGLLISRGISTDRFQYVSEDVIFDKKTGTTYFTDRKEYKDTKGDLYRYD
jgi:hypothetical protein